MVSHIQQTGAFAQQEVYHYIRPDYFLLHKSNTKWSRI